MDNIKDKRKVFQTEWFSIDALYYETDKPYYRLSCDDSVTIIARTIDEKIILIRQYRPAIEAFSLELPAGYIDEGESPEEAIKRELYEETGFTCDKIVYLGAVKIAPSRINTTVHVFAGKEATSINPEEIKEKKEIDTLLVSEEEFKELILQGKYVEIAGMAIYFLAQIKGYF